MTLPTLFIPHGAGPCFFMEWTRGPADTWDKTGAWLKGLVAGLPERPKAILIVSGHWEEPVFTVGSSAKPPMIFDYNGFPEETYRLRFDAPGSPALAKRVRELLGAAGFPSAEDAERGYDHGVFVPLKLATPEADIPVVQLSLRSDLDPEAHLAAGRALSPLRDEGVLIVGSGMSWHNMRGFSPAFTAKSEAFDAWLADALADPARRDEAIRHWDQAPYAREAHPREEHLAPLFVAAGAAEGEPGRLAFRDKAMDVALSGYEFGGPA
ncbi:MAG: extradiol ring-cleavage dioxygenase, class enzyme subunit [Phenylobacterium sp.]|jgi:aromatic ring-opening dioxygenase catalytic subunit (LigB family)|uniref:DODA-type extradiol aromatic ring-opening family dioxygenase n=1 Tax=Phenylobacterium sp. TaxID=1871053 RepID=UPI00262CC83E|nr:class III extradiol ring-cleavage dioxygenase [Phenylobacterium sp.]MDB5437074.1 extradiol ring-cleavage dioxygenase, class enzyme subunit [Phenylobacterium sp.]MDB5498196.1 extradiol ring-cleavage dioxygenase, class enzyme subunit [Phenylobacterium sp.]